VNLSPRYQRDPPGRTSHEREGTSSRRPRISMSILSLFGASQQIADSVASPAFAPGFSSPICNSSLWLTSRRDTLSLSNSPITVTARVSIAAIARTALRIEMAVLAR
jgi:hypothetical protein